MQYNFNGKIINIPDREIEKLMSSLELTQADAIDLWLCDNGYEVDEEQKELDEKASKVRILKDVEPKNAKKERKIPEKKVSEQKKALFSEILSDLEDVYKGKVEVLTENKLISVNIDGIVFKIDIIQQRPPKKTKNS
jgi:hypothetical protein